jgi:hypothetical protein
MNLRLAVRRLVVGLPGLALPAATHVHGQQKCDDAVTSARMVVRGTMHPVNAIETLAPRVSLPQCLDGGVSASSVYGPNEATVGEGSRRELPQSGLSGSAAAIRDLSWPLPSGVGYVPRQFYCYSIPGAAGVAGRAALAATISREPVMVPIRCRGNHIRHPDPARLRRQAAFLGLTCSSRPGRPKRKPWTWSQPSSTRTSICSLVSTPSARIDTSRLLPSATIALTNAFD